MGKQTKFWTSKNWLVSTIILKELKKLFPKYFKGKLLDIGCGDKPLESYLKPFVSEYVGLDHEGSLHDTANADLLGTAYKIPVQSEFYDTVLSTAVLEHLEEPFEAVKEACRVLKKEGYAIYSIPFFWHLHEEPRDFYRFTKYGIRYLFEKGGFELIELKPLSGFWVTFGQEFVYYLWRFRRGFKLNPLRWIIPPIGMSLQWIFYLLSKFDNSNEFTWMYLVVAKKK